MHFLVHQVALCCLYQTTTTTSTPIYFTMAITMSAEQGTAAMAAAGDDLVFLLCREGVPQDMQLKLFHIGIT